MEKSEILKKFLDRGLQLDFETLDYFSRNPTQLDLFFNKILNTTVPPTVTISLIEELLKEKTEEDKTNSSFSKRHERKNILSIDDVTLAVNRRYSFLRKLLDGRMELTNLISLNRITPKVKKFSAIVIVKEKIESENSIIGEDDTGEHKFFFKAIDDMKQILLDDTVGLICENDERSIVARVVWPDMSMRREVRKTSGDFYIFLGNGHIEATQLNSQNIPYREIFFKDGKIQSNGKTVTSPGTMVIEKNVTCLVVSTEYLKKYPEFNTNQIGFLVSLLKRRNLNPTIDFSTAGLNQDTFLIETIPDIFVAFNCSATSSTNYKGTSIFTLPPADVSRATWMINLKTREAKVV